MELTRTKIAELVGIDAKRIQFYIHQQVFDDLNFQGRGKPTLFKLRHLVEVFLIKELDRKGVALSAIKDILKQLRGYALFTNYFKNDRIKKLFSSKKHPKIYVIFFNESNKVDLKQIGREDTRIPDFDMMGYKSAVIIDLSHAFLVASKP
jgi:ssDNA-specific exonuclease RecJ